MKRKSLILIAAVLFLLLVTLNYNFLDRKLTDFVGNQSLTGGSILTTNPKVVCAKGYSASVRDVPLALKKEIYKMNGVPFPQPAGTVELDHVVSLELGGSNSIQNLKIEYRDPRPGYIEKDQVENYLHKLVCSGQMKLTDAQKQIATNWTNIYYDDVKKS